MRLMRRSLALCAFSSTLLASLPAAAATPVQPLDPPAATASEASEDGVSAWFVELSGAPAADGGSPAALAQEKKAFRDAARKEGIRLKERFSYDKLFNGFSVEVNEAGVSRLTRLPGVKNIYRVVEIERPQTAEEAPGDTANLATSLAMVQADIAQNDLGLTGRGIRVAIMDTGVDFDHPDLGGCFGPGCRVEVGYDFVGNTYNNDSTSPSYNPVPVPDAIPDDCNGHGTHVAGIVGADGTVRGVAPGVTFGAYRVFGCEGSTDADIMVAAMERIYADGAQVVNISIGSSYQWPNYPTAQAADRLVNKGVVVVTSAGNSGANGAYAVSAPGVGEKVIATASFQNTHISLPVFTVTPDNLAIAYSQATGALLAPLAGSSPLARTGTATSTDDACSALPAGSLAGKTALIRRGTCSFHIKAFNAQNAGAAGVVIYNNVAGPIQSITVVGPAGINIPVVSIAMPDGVTLNNRLASGAVDMTWTDQAVATPNSLANLIAGSSSHGISPTLSIKPDIGAPGNFIRSTFPLEAGAYANLSGTSMASPHVVGAVALLLEARPNTPAAAVRDILQNSAEPHLWSGNPGLGFLDMVHRQGAGMLQIVDAINSTTKVEPGKLSLGESEAGPATRTLRVKNSGTAPVTYSLSHVAALASRGTFTLSYYNAPATVTWSVPSLTVPAGGTATLNVTIAPDATLPDQALYGGYLVLTPQGGGREVRVPYAGFKGDYQSIRVLTPTANNFPWLAKNNAGTLSNQAGGATYTLQGDDIPYFVIHFDHQSRELVLEVFDADTGKAWHRVIREEYVPRNSGAATFYTFTWDGTTTSGGKTYTVPNGRYIVRATVRKALGESGNPAHVETWQSPVITIARP
jgi:minor extracellular serine protease Vpr